MAGTELTRPSAVTGQVVPSATPSYTGADYAVSAGAAERVLRAPAANTIRGYAYDWGNFDRWCTREGRTALPATAQTLLEYVHHLISDTEYGAPASIGRAIGCIRSRHRRAGHKGQPDSQAAMDALRSYRRDWAQEGNSVAKAVPVTVSALRAMVATCDLETATGSRDRALLLVGFSIMARESELSQLNTWDVSEDAEEGLTVHIRHSKTDQDAKGVAVAVPYGQHADTCPVRAWRHWAAVLADRGRPAGALFRPVDRLDRIAGEPGKAGTAADRLTGRSVSAVVTRRARLAGLPNPDGYTGHSLRAGGATSAYAAGAPVSEIAKHGRWAENSPVVLGYIRAVDKWKNNPMKGIGL